MTAVRIPTSPEETIEDIIINQPSVLVKLGAGYSFVLSLPYLMPIFIQFFWSPALDIICFKDSHSDI
jgi:hypothetical protein